MRGLAAVAVLVLHSAPVVFAADILPSAYRAVDLFFVLSGFVIATAYEPRFARGLTVSQFFTTRLIRLYPLFFLGSLVGLGGLLATIVVHHAEISLVGAGKAAALNLLMLPSWFTAAEVQPLFPLNGPAWSLFWEMVVNFVYVIAWPILTTRRLIGLTAISAAALATWSILHGKADGGVYWEGAASGGLRAAFGFSLGVLFQRARGFAARREGPVSYLLLALLIPIFATPLAWQAWSDPLCVFLLIPALVWAGISVEPPPRARSTFAMMGAVSYALYALHFPVLQWVARVLKLLPPHALTPWIGFAFLPLVILGAWAADRWFDAPVRAWISGRLARQPLPAQAAKLK
jgi:peptidoglycan/LPS O-acetylase OafA/YrhL